MKRRKMGDCGVSMGRAVSILLTIGIVMAGCASSGDVEKLRQEREQAKAKIRTELQQERNLAASMEKESEAQKAAADKLARALGGTAAAKTLASAQSGAMSLTTALTTSGCQQAIAANPPNPAVPAALFINSATPCGNVTISTTDTTPFSATSPLIPVVVGAGGTLTFQDPGAGNATTLYASSFLIQNAGTMQAGTVTGPIAGRITIVMAGNSSAALPPTTGDQNANLRDITVMDGGMLKLYGGKGLSAAPGTMNNDTVSGTKSWTYLAVPAGPAKYNDGENVSAPVPTTNPSTTLTLANAVDWKVNDWVSVATTSFSSHQTEIVQICGVTSVANPDPKASALGLPANVSQLTLCNKLKHYHFGGLVPTPGFFPANTTQAVVAVGSPINVSFQAKSFYDDHSRNYGIDERAEVALLSRNIKLTSVAGQSTDANNFIGGHLVAMVSTGSSPTLQLVGVEIEKFGQGLTGRYPAHLHKLPSGSGVLVQDVSVHHSYNKCYVVHGTGSANFYNNVCVRTVGQGVYLEDGAGIKHNQFMRNHIAGTMAANSTYSFPQQNGSLYWDGDNLQIQNSRIQNGTITGATNANPIVVTTTASVPVNGTQVTISGVQGNTAANGTWTVAAANPTAGTFALQGSTGNGTFVQPGGAWAISGMNKITSITQDASTHLVLVNTQSLSSQGLQVTISGTNTPVDGQWTIASASGTSFTLSNTQSISPSTYTSYSCCSGTWTASGGITNATNASPIVVTTSAIAPAVGDQVTITGVTGNTAANGSWTVTNINATQFSLNGSTGNGNYPKATWAAANPFPTWYTVNSIPDTSRSGLNKNAIDSSFPGGFWITNLDNIFFNNSVAGCQASGRGYWLLSQDQTDPTLRYAYPEFAGNRAHACYNGIDSDDNTGNADDPRPTMTGTESGQPPVVLLNDNTVTRSRNRGFWGRGIFITLHNNRLATNPFGFSLLGGGGPEGNLPGFWFLAHENVIAGMTRNNVERYPACANAGNNWQQECTDVTLNGPGPGFSNYPSPNMNIQGYSYYDGPARIEHNRFVNFRTDPTGIQTDKAARLLTKTDIQNIATYGSLGQLHGVPTPNLYSGYAGDPAAGWQQANAQSVPPTQYIENSIWDNVDFKHQVYTEAVNMGPFNDGDKTTVILDKDTQLTGLKIVDGSGRVSHQFAPVSLNNLDFFATDYTVDEPHSRGRNDFRATSLMSPHKYATLNVESVTNPGGIVPPAATQFRVVLLRDMPAYGDTVYPSLFLNGRGQNSIYEPFVMDRMGYTIYGAAGTEHGSITPSQFQNRLLFSYTDPAVKKAGDYFINRIAVYQPVGTPGNIKVYRVRRQWGQQYTNNWPPSYNPPGPAASSCDNTFYDNQPNKDVRWTDCLNRANNQSPYNAAPYTQLGYPFGMTLTAASSWQSFNQSYTDLMSGRTTAAQFITNQTFFYDAATSMLYFYMIEDQPVQTLYEPYGTCGGGQTQYAANVAQVQGIKKFSDPNSVKAALDASCFVNPATATPQPTDLVTCGAIGCAAYLVDLSTAAASAPATLPSAPTHSIARTDYAAVNQYHLVYGTPAQQPNGLPVVANAAIGNTPPPTDGHALTGAMTPTDGTSPPSGDQVTYTFLTLSNTSVQVTENFSYRCVTTPPWAPVNARGTYPGGGGTTYPRPATVCGSP